MKSMGTARLLHNPRNFLYFPESSAGLLEASCPFCNRNGDCIQLDAHSDIYCDCHPPYEGKTN